MDRLELVAEPRRREILRLVWNGPLAVSEIAARVPVTIGAVSQHLAKLHEAGLVTLDRQGRRRLYAADRDALADLAPMLEAMWHGDLDRLAERAERAQRRRRRS
ncbi:MAG: metalloregulator ArsR/SmtB family transcription factor [Actinomycetota bacterium]